MYTKEQIQAMIDQIAPKYGIKKAILFGSYAHGTATEESDVDVLITLPDGLDSFDAKFRIGMELEEMLGVYADVLVAPLSQHTIFVLDENGVPIYMEGAERDQRLIPVLLRGIERLHTRLAHVSQKEFLQDDELGDFVSMRIIKLTERMKNGFFERHPDIPRKEILRMRNALAHNYLYEDEHDLREVEIDYERVWQFLHKVLFPLESQLKT
jgi:predicted nucleotidyltransferase/uncharacterized protein with HEPN domain